MHIFTFQSCLWLATWRRNSADFPGGFCVPGAFFAFATVFFFIVTPISPWGLDRPASDEFVRKKHPHPNGLSRIIAINILNNKGNLRLPARN